MNPESNLKRTPSVKEKKQITAFIRRLWGLAHFAPTFVGYIFGMFATASEPSRRAEHEGTDLIGDYNYRTNELDAGTDPYGWYEEDM